MKNFTEFAKFLEDTMRGADIVAIVANVYPKAKGLNRVVFASIIDTFIDAYCADNDIDFDEFLKELSLARKGVNEEMDDLFAALGKEIN